MPRLRYDEFIGSLERLKKDYPEYANILKSLINELNKGKGDSLRRTLKKLEEEDW